MNISLEQLEINCDSLFVEENQYKKIGAVKDLVDYIEYEKVVANCKVKVQVPLSFEYDEIISVEISRFSYNKTEFDYSTFISLNIPWRNIGTIFDRVEKIVLHINELYNVIERGDC